ncbi:hypothetical protein [Candidatus Uabimicrobium sp. HlEnr_7]|uniref:hypothetical protein n=1 Tax=Candidatus Uabimicrobium helgolandensis TaxID=3095367 RepID=UPI003558103A
MNYVYIADNHNIWKSFLAELKNRKQIKLENLELIAELDNRIYGFEVKRDLIAVGQVFNKISLLENKQLLYSSKNEKEGEIKVLAWANLQNLLVFVRDNQLITLQKNEGKWQEKPLLKKSYEFGVITDIQFHPQDKYLAIFNEEEFFIYDFQTKYLCPSSIGFLNSVGAYYTKDWSKLVCPANTELVIFDMSRQKFSYFPEYFQDDKRPGQYWPIQTKKN